MDMDDDDAFLYGDQSPQAETAAENPADAADAQSADANGGLSASMAASLAAYGIDPTTAVAEEPLEDGGVEEEDDSDEDSDDSDDDIKLVMTGGPQRTLDLRKPQPQQTSNVIGIGRWAHTATANAPPAASPTAVKTAPKASAASDALTDYTPAARPGMQGPTAAAQPPTDASHLQLTPGNGPPPTTALPHSTLPVQAAPGTDPRIDGTHPTGVIPSTGTSVYDVDVAQFEGSGQMWRRPGSDISDWFNYGFDEITYPKYLRYKQDMEQGRMALANMTGMAPMTPDVANMLHLPTGGVNPQLQQMQMQQQMQQMQQQMMAMGGMDPAAMFAMQNQGMPGMGMMPGMMQQGNDAPGDQEEGAVSSNDSPVAETAPQGQMQNAFPGRGQNVPPRGGMVMGRGMNMPLRGRGGAPLGPRGVVAGNVPIPKGPKVGRFKDKDRVNEMAAAAASTSLDYGDNPSDVGSRDQSPSRYGGSERERDRYGDGESRYGDREARAERDRYGDRERGGERERETRSSSRRERDYDGGNQSEGEYDDRGERSREHERESDRYGERESRRTSSRRNESSTPSAPASGSAGGGLGPDGWESGEEDDRRRRKRSRSAEEEAPRRSTRAKRR